MNDGIRAALADLLAITEAMNVRTLLVGAWARLCLPEGRRGPARMTADVDLTALIEDWAAVDVLFNACSPRFEDRRKDRQ